ncbi:MAG: type III deoxyribonuclease, partial [candidate division WOR-3 bacterium]
SKSIKESKQNYDNFLSRIRNLRSKDIRGIEARAKGTDLEKAFNYFRKENITYDNLIRELQEDFAPEKVMLLDSENVDEEKQLLLNSLESRNNEIRAIFAVNMLNEGWDVLNLFDIVRLYDTRDGKWVRGKYKPGTTTIGECQLIGRGARYYPFQLDETQDKYKRKFDDDINNDLRIIETLHYHSARNPDYIVEIKSALTERGILPERYVQQNLFIKNEFKETEFWKRGNLFINERIQNPRSDIFRLGDAGVEKEYSYNLKTGEIKEEIILAETENQQKSFSAAVSRKEFAISEFGDHIIRSALDRLEFYKFAHLRRYFPHLKSLREFISSPNYLGVIKVNVSGPKDKLENLSPQEKMEIVLSILKSISEQAVKNVAEFKGTRLFKAHLLREIFRDKIIKIDADAAKDMNSTEINIADRNWYAQTAFYGTDEESNFIRFMENIITDLRKRYDEIALLRNEKFFQIFDFDEGRAFEPDFVLMLRKKNREILVYQVFIEPKGDQFKDKDGKFEYSKEGWKQKFLLELKNNAEPKLLYQNEHYKLLGLPFYNEKLKKDFKKAFEDELLL